MVSCKQVWERESEKNRKWQLKEGERNFVHCKNKLSLTAPKYGTFSESCIPFIKIASKMKSHTHTHAYIQVHTYTQAFNNATLWRGVGQRESYTFHFDNCALLKFFNFYMYYFYFKNSNRSYLARKNIFLYFLCFTIQYKENNIHFYRYICMKIHRKRTGKKRHTKLAITSGLGLRW